MASGLIPRKRCPMFLSALMTILFIGFVYNAYLHFSQGTQRLVLLPTGVIQFGVSPEPVNHSKWSDSPIKHPKKSNISDSTVEKECVLSRGFGKGLTLTALASTPGSGNTWVRNLLEESTGYYTGSIYNDGALKKSLKGESRRDGTVIAIKSHRASYRRREVYERAVVLLRNPRDSLLSEFHREYNTRKSHVGRAPATMFEKEWNEYFAKNAESLLLFVKFWFVKFKGPLYVVHYEQLKSNLRETLRGVLDFLDIEIDENRLNCVVQNAEGNFRRPPDPNAIDPYTTAMITKLDNITQQAEEIIKKRLEEQKLQLASMSHA